ncbi:23S rRNA (cytidine1920-2'-O)/16S rRNA (cytidine1409-2'-O)-methyltransferase [Peptostreptococcaceae bacterium pGA-8]|nr:23S rRNA (cytidine1920-2'-O)/16S rRNA (cytidine1409-2'-O)-methyltransferase [Peptostreptococcaceae bacterium pGA-8]
MVWILLQLQKGYVITLKNRLDIILVEKGLFTSRERAKAAIMAGTVFVDGQKEDKPGTQVSSNQDFFVKENPCPYVSRGGLKLEKSIKEWSLDLRGKIAMDIGASTGGFTDCMLINGASKVYAVDVGYGQLDWKLRNDSRVCNMEKCNIRYLNLDDIAEPIDFVSIDVSFISLKHVFPVVSKLLSEDGMAVALVKPQFEAGREQVGKKGIVRDKAVHKEVIEKVIEYALENDLHPVGLTFSPVTGAKGNIEFLLCVAKKEYLSYNSECIDKVVEDSHGELK